MNYPIIDPIFVAVGPLTIYWYGVMYMIAFGVFFLLGRIRVKSNPTITNTAMLADLLFYGVFGVVLGGRVGYFLFYGSDQLLEDPLLLLKIWEGGMSFHGGLCGVLVTTFIYARSRKLDYLAVTDFVAPLVPIGLGIGRIGNFMNTELPGRVTEFALGVHFPCHAVSSHNMLCIGEWEAATRHISSLYQACTEGVILFVVVWWFSSRPRQVGFVSGVFLISAGILRLFTEMFREPDAMLGYLLFDTVTMGQILSIPVILGGIALLLQQSRRVFGLER